MKKSKGYRDDNQVKRGYNRHLTAIRRKNRKRGFSGKKTKKRIAKKVRRKEQKAVTKKYTSVIHFLSSKKYLFTKLNGTVPKHGVLSLPEIFSLSDRPIESFQFLKDLYRTLNDPLNENLFIDYQHCKRIDLDASICMDIILKEYIQLFRKRSHFHDNRIKYISGINLKDEKLKRFNYSIGAHKTIRGLKMNYPGIITYELHEGQRSSSSGFKELESTHLVEYIENCLKRMNKKLTQKAKEGFADIFGEIISNAEEHSSTKFRYSIGYFEECDDRGEHIGNFQFLIFNLGDSIYEHLLDKEACKNHEILKEMKELSEKYTKKGWLGLGVSEFQEETLWTLYALQEGVSCVDAERGNGTISFIESFLNLRSNEPSDNSKMFLLSGNTFIIFDGKYLIKNKVNVNGESHKVITFNDSDSLDDQPSKNHVKFADNYFPGTMLYANICIKEENIKQP